ncbi:MAG: hypothetical protein KDC43_03175 [Saprospiraceae bacterium]|nr:hypothetical protein [Saprospiraceae bacterium]MCB0622936.1 hypothetical protein [Saprospiraceae bacterium]MCB0675720.1 hypothetical protein [Saprospiraceae bacterium]MCB0680538.1 hypothetical protein [Saprospiraceae bacterium]
MKTLLPALKWIARLIGLLFVLLLVANMLSSGLPELLKFSWTETLELVGLLLMITGIFQEYRWELVGGLLMIAGYLVFAVAEGQVLVGLVFPFIFVAGALHVLVWIWKRNSHE